MSTRNRILTASRFFEAAHGDQTYGPFPYMFHLQSVVDVGRSHITQGMLDWAGVTSEQMTIILYGHDSIEDTPVTKGMIAALYGKVVADAIDAVSDVPGKDRHHRKWGTPTNPGPMLKLQENRAGLIAKLCDRIANSTASKSARDKLPPQQQRKDKYAVYCGEQEDFYTTLYTRDTPLQPLWDALNLILGYEPV